MYSCVAFALCCKNGPRELFTRFGGFVNKLSKSKRRKIQTEKFEHAGKSTKIHLLYGPSCSVSFISLLHGTVKFACLLSRRATTTDRPLGPKMGSGIKYLFQSHSDALPHRKSIEYLGWNCVLQAK